MTAAERRHADESFEIHEDARTEDTVIMGDDGQVSDRAASPGTDEPDRDDVHQDETQEMQTDADHDEQVDDEAEDDDGGDGGDDDDGDGDDNESSEDEQVESGVQADMERLQRDYPGFKEKYRLIKRIGEGSTPSNSPRHHD